MRRTLAAALVVLALVPAVHAQDLLNGFLPGPDPTEESHKQDAELREILADRDWIVFTNLHPKKRKYDNLEKRHRAAYRKAAQRLVKALWLRGCMNDPLRAYEALDAPHIFQTAVDRDPCGKDPVDCKPQRETDFEAEEEERAMTAWLLAHSPGERLIPVSNEEHLMFQERLKAPYVGLGQERIGFAKANEDLVRDRMHRHFKWGKYKDVESWRVKIAGLRESLAKRRPPIVVVMGTLASLQKRMEDRVQNKLGDKTAFTKKNEIYTAAMRSMGGDPQIQQAIELIVQGEVLTARLARGELHASDTPGRNQMHGMALVIAGAAAAYVESPNYDTLMRLGGVGVMGARVRPSTQ